MRTIHTKHNSHKSQFTQITINTEHNLSSLLKSKIKTIQARNTKKGQMFI